MRPLLVLNAAAGLLLGVVAALAWHYARLRDAGWFAYAPLSQHPAHVTWVGGSWLPEVVVGPVGGLLLGTALGWLLHRLGWRLVRAA